MPIGTAVSSAINHLAEQLAKAGAKIARDNDSLPDLADSARIYMRLLGAVRSGGETPEIYEKAKIAVATLQPGDTSLAAERSRGLVMNHRDWLATDQARQRLKEQWRRLYREWDIVLYSPAPFPAFPRDHFPAD
jgi:amidase